MENQQQKPMESEKTSSFLKSCTNLEIFFWRTRFIALTAVVSSLLISAFWFLYIFVDLFNLGSYVVHHIGTHGFRDQAVFSPLKPLTAC